MIRFIDLNKQIASNPNDPEWAREFAFFDTLEARFVVIGNQQIFDSREDVLDNLDENDSAYAKRILGLLPEWVPKSVRIVAR